MNEMNRQKDLIYLIIVIIIFGLVLGFGSHKKYSSTITDVSWPNCGSKTIINYQEGIIGVTGGLDFHPNPCLRAETSWFGHYALYINSGYPGMNSQRKFVTSPLHCTPADSNCLAYNYGFAAAQYALRVADQAGAYTNLWWIDVETDNSWTNSTLVNRASLEGMIAAIRQGSFLPEIGIYSTPDQWAIITGGWHNKLPIWIATGALNSHSAALACQTIPFTDGPMWLSQYTTVLDGNIACSNSFTQRVSGLQ